MRIERIRKLIWGVDVLIILGAGLCFWLFFFSALSDLPYDRPEEWAARGKTDPGMVKLREPDTWRDYEIAMLKFPMSGPRPEPEIVIDPETRAGPIQTEMEKIADLVSYRRFIPSTDEASITLAMKAGGPPVTLRVGHLVPGTVWMLVDVEKNKAIFKHTKKVDADLQHLTKVAPEITMPGGGVGLPGADGDAPSPGSSEPDPVVARDEPKPVEVRPGVWEWSKDDAKWFESDNHVESVRQSIKVQPWKNPESGRYEGVKISKVKPNSYLARRGAKKGDILVSINGVPVSSREGVINYIRKNGESQTQFTVKLIRNGQPKTLTYTRRK
jgi:PDZ domain